MQRCTLHWNVKLYIIISARIITLTEIHCNWDRDVFIPKYKTFLTPYHCLIFFQIHWSNELKKGDIIRNEIVASECFCLIRLTAVNVAICRKWRIRIKAGLWVYWVNYRTDIQLKWSTGLTHLTNDRPAKNFIRIEIQIYLLHWFSTDRAVPLSGSNLHRYIN